MNHSAVRYKRKLKRKLQCSRGTKADLLADFTHSLDGFLDENPDATFADLGNAFGPPEEMAKTLMEQVSEQETHTYKRQQFLLHIVAIILAIVLLLITLDIFLIKQRPLEVVNGTNVVDDFDVADGAETVEGE